MPSYKAELLRATRAIIRLRDKRRKLRRELKTIDDDIRRETRHMRVLMARTVDDGFGHVIDGFRAGVAEHVAKTGTGE